MPLLHSASPSAFKTNVKALMGEVGRSAHVKSPKQALAIAYSEKRRAQHRAPGGYVGFGSGMLTAGQPSAPAAPAAGAAGIAPALPQVPWMFGGQAGAPVAGPPMPAVSAPMPQPTPVAPPTMTPATMGRQAAQPVPLMSVAPVGGVGATSSLPPSLAPIGGAGLAIGGVAPAPWQVRAEAHNLMHTGPILSAVPGRTDRHNMAVPSGSYVLPAETLSHLGQSNTLAGMKVANRMFGSGGPYGSGAMGVRHGMGAPRPPKPMGIMADRGGARGDGVGSPTDVVTAGGEFVIEPHVVASIGGGDLKRGHRILDKWVMQLRKDHIRTLKKLAPPAKS